MRLRSLTSGERTLIGRVFGAALDPGPIRLFTGVSSSRYAFVAFNLMVFPSDVPDFAMEPITTQAWFVHELAHAWQFQHRPGLTLASWAGIALTGGYLTGRAYRYTLPLEWPALNIEQQAKAIEHAFLLARRTQTPDMPPGAAMADYATVPFR
jgi:hypothetical protein